MQGQAITQEKRVVKHCCGAPAGETEVAEANQTAAPEQPQRAAQAERTRKGTKVFSEKATQLAE